MLFLPSEIFLSQHIRDEINSNTKDYIAFFCLKGILHVNCPEIS